MTLNRFSNIKLLELPNCVGLLETGRCLWLNITTCEGNSCPFKKSSEEKEIICIKAYKRLASLDDSLQTHISNKYYQGKRPWREDKL